MQRRPFLIVVGLFSIALFLPSDLSAVQESAKLSLPSFFSNNMVLQREKPIAIWGWAEANQKVEVAFNQQVANAQADSEGNWKIVLPAMGATQKGSSLVVECGRDRLEVKNVVVGEVWFASGQSNMVFMLKNSHEAKQDLAEADNDSIRMFLAANTPASEPQSNIKGAWQVSSTETAGEFSAVAYFFAKRIHEETGVPVGIIKSCIGGKRVECYTSREAMLANEVGRTIIADLDAKAAKYDEVTANSTFEGALAKWQTRTAEAREFNKGKTGSERKRIPRRPRRQLPVYENPGNPTVLYNGMIHPFVGYSIRGAIWYQGEANAKPGLAGNYEEMFTLMIKDWRKRWGDDFAFYFVQLANFKKATTEAGGTSDWATVQEMQRQTLNLSGTGMATINDVGAANDIHPKNKKTVGDRLARWALKNQYAKDIVVSGPLYKSHKIRGSEVIVEFEHVGKGLKSRDGEPLKRFEIFGADGEWHWGNARIENDTVVVSSQKVAQPVAVRYAWAANPQGANLVNSEDLPASIFSTEKSK